jgi:P pilus assembly chaperone PapD
VEVAPQSVCWVRLLKASKKQPCPGKKAWWMIAKETEEQKKESGKGNEILVFVM